MPNNQISNILVFGKILIKPTCKIIKILKILIPPTDLIISSGTTLDRLILSLGGGGITLKTDKDSLPLKTLNILNT